MRSGTSSRRVRSSRLGDITAPKVQAAKPRGSPRGLRGRTASAAAAAAAAAAAVSHHHPRQHQRSNGGAGSGSLGADAGHRREEWGDERSGEEVDGAREQLSALVGFDAVSGNGGIDLDDGGNSCSGGRTFVRGRRPMKQFEGSEGLLLLSMIAEAQEPAKSRKRVKLPDMPTRRCGYCGARSTVQWRSGPKEIPILCNACGVKYRKGKLYLKDITADRAVKNENLENTATLDRLHLGDQGVSQCVGGDRSSHAVPIGFESDTCDSKGKIAEMNYQRMPPPRRPLADGLPQDTVVVPNLPNGQPVWEFIPPLVLQNRSGSMSVRPGFNNMYPCGGRFMPLLPVRPFLPTGEGTPGELMGSLPHSPWSKWDLQSSRLGDFVASASGKELQEATDDMQIEDVSETTRVQAVPKELERHAIRVKENLHMSEEHSNDGEETLRWLVKRKRTGPKIVE